MLNFKTVSAPKCAISVLKSPIGRFGIKTGIWRLLLEDGTTIEYGFSGPDYGSRTQQNEKCLDSFNKERVKKKWT